MKQTIRMNNQIATAVVEIFTEANLPKESEVFEFAYSQLVRDINSSGVKWHEIIALTLNVDRMVTDYPPTRTITVADSYFEIVLNDFQRSMPHIQRVKVAYLTKLALLYTLNKLQHEKSKEKELTKVSLKGIDVIKEIVLLLEDDSMQAHKKLNQIRAILGKPAGFENKEIHSLQKVGSLDIDFDPDSSALAYEHYLRYYKDNPKLKDYDFLNLFLYNYFCKDSNDVNYYNNVPKSKNNRIYVLHKDAEFTNIEGVDCVAPTRRLSGDIICNLNSSKARKLSQLLRNNSEGLEKLNKLKKQTYTLINMCLLESMGGLNTYKGRDELDRFDVFIASLDSYFKGESKEVLMQASVANQNALFEFLSEYKDIYEFVETFYFISDKDFVNRIIFEGKSPIENSVDAMRYLQLIEDFWKIRTEYFTENY